jgi:hypothetical protein
LIYAYFLKRENRFAHDFIYKKSKFICLNNACIYTYF